jgi:REP element-mobilizing transposase RayT
MAQTLVSLLAHVIFSTKNREPLITPEIEPELFAYIGGILKNNESRLLDAGGTFDHVHLPISQSKNISLSSLMKDVKKDSSSWIKTKGSETCSTLTGSMSFSRSLRGRCPRLFNPSASRALTTIPRVSAESYSDRGFPSTRMGTDEGEQCKVFLLAL